MKEPNRIRFWTSAIVVVVLGGVLSVIYSVATRNVSGSFGIVAYMVAAQSAVLMT